MTSGKRTEPERRWRVLRLHRQNWSVARIASACDLDRKTVRLIIDDAARRWWDIARPTWADELADEP